VPRAVGEPSWVFAALDVPPELVALAIECQAQLADVPGVQLQRPEDLHLTVIPPWEERNVPAVLRDFAAIGVPPLPLRATGIGYGPHGKPPALAWVTCDLTPDVEKLWLQTWRALWSQNPPPGTFPHVTFAYVPEGADLPELLLPREAGGTATKVSLLESLGGHRYEVLGGKMLGS
jgi:2'-5' RNA ligase